MRTRGSSRRQVTGSTSTATTSATKPYACEELIRSSSVGGAEVGMWKTSDAWIPALIPSGRPCGSQWATPAIRRSETAPVGRPLHAHLAVHELEVVGGAPRAGSRRSRGSGRLTTPAALPHRTRGDPGEPARVRARRHRPDRRVAVERVDRRDVVGRQPELVGDHLRDRRLVALPLRRRAHRDDDLAARAHPHLRPVGRRPTSGCSPAPAAPRAAARR